MKPLQSNSFESAVTFFSKEFNNECFSQELCTNNNLTMSYQEIIMSTSHFLELYFLVIIAFA